jgi:hypothetical protein
MMDAGFTILGGSVAVVIMPRAGLLRKSGFDSRQGQKSFTSVTMSKLSMELTQSPVKTNEVYSSECLAWS